MTPVGKAAVHVSGDASVLASALASALECRQNHARAPGRVVVVGVNGDAESAAAARCIASLEIALGMHPVAVRAYYPAMVPSPTPPPAVGWAARTLESTGGGARLQLRRVSPATDVWPVLVIGGAPAEVIVTAARELGAALVAIGLRGGGPIGVGTGSETVLRVMRTTRVPVLATTTSLHGIPRRVMVAVDFDRASVVAARAAMALLADGGVLDLVHVDRSPREPTDGLDGDAPGHGLGEPRTIERFVEELDVPMHVEVVTAMRRGSACEQLMAHALSTEPDLLAVRCGRHATMNTVTAGTVAGAFIRDARWSLLVVPPDDAHRTTGRDVSSALVACSPPDHRSTSGRAR